MSRRLTISLLAAFALLAACGDDGSSSDTSLSSTTEQSQTSATTSGSSVATTAPSSTAPDDVDANGIVRTYYDLVNNGGPEFDPSKARISTEQYMQDLIYGSLFTVAVDGTYEPNLAKSAKVVDPITVQIELNAGINFSDGSPFNAEAVKFSVERNRDAKNSVLAAELQQIESITVDSPTVLTLKLKAPIAGAIYDLLPLTTFAVVSPTAVQSGTDLSTKPVGAGPFLLDEYQPGRVVKYKKNPSHFKAAQVRLAGVEVIHAEVGQAQVTAMRSNAVDISGENFTFAQSKEIASSGWKSESYLSGNVMTYGQMCKSRPPFDDIRVRQALNYAIDRDAINKAVLDGGGAPMWGLFPPDHPLHSAELDGYYKRDVNKAKELLAAAGKPDLTFNTFFVQSQRITEIVQAQLAEAGITMNILPYTAGGQQFYPDGATAEMNLLRLARSGVAKVSRTLMPPSIGNVCNYNDPEIIALVGQLQGMAATDPKFVSTWKELQKIVVEDALNFAVVFEPSAIAWNSDRIGNATFELNLRGERLLDLEKIYIKK